jgi:hypothetical protein
MSSTFEEWVDGYGDCPCGLATCMNSVPSTTRHSRITGQGGVYPDLP